MCHPNIESVIYYYNHFSGINHCILIIIIIINSSDKFSQSILKQLLHHLVVPEECAFIIGFRWTKMRSLLAPYAALADTI